jgi:hypothetical protein
MIELQTSVKTSKQDNTTRTRTPKPGYLKLTITSLSALLRGLGILTRTFPTYRKSKKCENESSAKNRTFGRRIPS